MAEIDEKALLLFPALAVTRFQMRVVSAKAHGAPGDGEVVPAMACCCAPSWRREMEMRGATLVGTYK